MRLQLLDHGLRQSVRKTTVYFGVDASEIGDAVGWVMGR